jgi:hypothetical protein
VKILLLLMTWYPLMAFADVQGQRHMREKQGMSMAQGMESVNDSVEKVISNKPKKSAHPTGQKAQKAKPLEAKGRDTRKIQEERTKYNEYQTILRNDTQKDQQQEHDLLLRDTIDTMYKKLH